MEARGAEDTASPRSRLLSPGKGKFGQKSCTQALCPFQDWVHGQT